MPNLTLYHNPRCSKSREALALLEENDIEVDVVRYLDAPLDRAALEGLLQRLDGGLEAMVRTNEAEWKSLGLDPTNRYAVLSSLALYPRLMQRPILDRGDRAVVGRPPEAVLALVSG